jgi:hypothetical protein
MNKQPRKVEFYDMCVFNKKDQGIGHHVTPLFDSLLNLPNDRFKELHFGETLNLVRTKVTLAEDKVIFGKMTYVKRDQFNMTYNPDTGKSKDLSEGTGDSEGIVETTHFVIIDTDRGSIVGLEVVQQGPKIGSLNMVVSSLLSRLNKQDQFEVVHEYKIGIAMAERLSGFREAGLMRIRVRQSEIASVSALYDEIGAALGAAQRISNTDWVELIFGFEMRGKNKPNSSKLIEVAKRLLQLDAEHQFFNHIRKATIEAKEEDSERVTPFDLIRERTNVVIYAAKAKDKLKYYDSGDVHKGIRTELRKNFGV